jgi:hypothetical protein
MGGASRATQEEDDQMSREWVLKSVDAAAAFRMTAVLSAVVYLVAIGFSLGRSLIERAGAGLVYPVDVLAAALFWLVGSAMSAVATAVLVALLAVLYNAAARKYGGYRIKLSVVNVDD